MALHPMNTKLAVTIFIRLKKKKKTGERPIEKGVSRVGEESTGIDITKVHCIYV